MLPLLPASNASPSHDLESFELHIEEQLMQPFGTVGRRKHDGALNGVLITTDHDRKTVEKTISFSRLLKYIS